MKPNTLAAIATQDRRRRAGLCIRCGEPRGLSLSIHYCEPCHQVTKAAARARYRRKAGIPVDAPVREYNIRHQLRLQLAHAFRRALARHAL